MKTENIIRQTAGYFNLISQAWVCYLHLGYVIYFVVIKYSYVYPTISPVMFSYKNS